MYKNKFTHIDNDTDYKYVIEYNDFECEYISPVSTASPHCYDSDLDYYDAVHGYFDLLDCDCSITLIKYYEDETVTVDLQDSLDELPEEVYSSFTEHLKKGIEDGRI